MVGMTDEPAPGHPARSRSRKVLGGVCGGLARHYGLDPVIFRVPVVVLSVLGGLGLIAYGVAWLLFPFEDEEENEGRRLLSGRVEGPGLTALLFIVAGCGLLLASLSGGEGETMSFSVIVLIAMAGAAHWSRRRGRAPADRAVGVAAADAVAARAVADAPPEAQPPPPPRGAPWWGAPAAGHEAPAGGYLWGPAAATAAGPGDVTHQPGERAPRERGDGRRLGRLVLLLALAAGAMGTAVAWGDGSLRTATVTGLACALAVFGAGLVVSAFVGRIGPGTLTAVALTGVLLTGAAALPDTVTTSFGETRWRPGQASDVRGRYEAGNGQITLDLSELDLAAGQRVTTEVRAGMGQVRVIVPAGVDLTVHAEIGMGEYEYENAYDGSYVAGDSWGGVGQERTARYPGGSGTGEAGGITLRLELGIGQVSVARAERSR